VGGAHKLSLIHRSTGIIISTIEAMSELGFQNLSTKEIAKRQGVSEGTLYRHFKNKDAILLAVLDHFGQYDDVIIEFCRNKGLNPIETIKAFMMAYAEYYENYPEITAIEQAYDSLLASPELHDKVRSIMVKRHRFVHGKIEEAKASRIYQQSLDSENLTSLLIGGAREICLEWRMKKQAFSLKERTISMLEMLLTAFINKGGKGL
jgi:AcrR family transcriptional regulator